ncbi:hypothetical protein BMS3Abin07_00739 [bacterium BMS3Abin07]|nr:hypothetical protein BMS3Abin07_00739 [bacterium BMS3Abin07]GBE32972.1 hypothetical protein BMS3Bbin05_01904 [bacterium BMS3Bbin05]HDL21019.1 putative sulfate exporter family transporter [Nitrospirota bacterium]HDO22986.1 putative sulfate exporter family transporter [Nitrospirota bacterium]HDZ87676.1 putative sulfate exporter family transporter [Nitrospirota bacterium]
MNGRTIGVLFSLLIAVISFVLSTLHPAFDALVISIILGMIIANLFNDRQFLDKGIKMSLKIFLPIGIALYGAQLSVSHISPYYWPAVMIVFLSMFFLIYFVSGTVGVDRRLGVLLATGFSVCGASAIAIVSPLIGAKNEETSLSVIVVMMFGLIGMVLYPIFGDLLSLSNDAFAFITGTTLPMLGQVKVTAAGYSNESYRLAVNFKLLRMSMLIFIVTVAILLSPAKGRRFYVPWFVIVFIVLAVLVNLFHFQRFSEYAGYISKFSLSTALAAIGLSVDFDYIAEGGFRPLFIIGVSWVIVVSVIYLVLVVLNV